MPKLTISGACFHGFEFSVGPKRGEGSPVVIAEFSAPWNEKNREAGGWEEIPETVSGNVKLVPSELAATHIEFKPRAVGGFSLDCSAATDFSCFVPTKEGEARELRFRIKSSSIKAGRELDSFGRSVGSAAGTLRISHDTDAQATIDDAQGTLEEK